ncbi:unnamed protein product [Urochloa decumbens]|uniref:Endonuclease/exonuclease/phosphatase domain-containing protein n=1 Tax=Urochloa decumbens TaxID=240449 RepID=A0ABC9FX75_9POAL
MDATKQLKFLTYNVWSPEDVVVYKRMQAIGTLVDTHNPDVILFQEVTAHIRSIFEDLPWWKKYHCSPVPPEEELATNKPFCLLADINPDRATMKPIRVATTQLERPSPPSPMRCVERYAQAEHAVAALGSAENVVFGGDMCWRDGIDRPFPLPAGWFDAWTALRRSAGGSSYCWTYDSIWEEEVAVTNGFSAPYESLLIRSDRFVCKLKDYSLKGIEIIGDSQSDTVLSYTKASLSGSFMSIK